VLAQRHDRAKESIVRLSGSVGKGLLTACGKSAGMLRSSPAHRRRKNAVAAPNYSYEKRQRELAKKRKQEDKRNKKANPRPDGEPGEPEPAEGALLEVPPGAPASGS